MLSLTQDSLCAGMARVSAVTACICADLCPCVRGHGPRVQAAARAFGSMWTTYVAPLGDRGTGTQNINRGQVSAVSLPEREKSWRGLCRPWGLSAPDRRFLSCGSFLLSC